MTPQKPELTLERIASIRTQISDLAGRSDVLAMVARGGYHPDLKLGDAIHALDELSAAMQNYDLEQRLSAACGDMPVTK